MALRFPWKRWLCRRDKEIRFETDGYPHDPAGPWAAAFQPDCIALEAILDERYAVLLGETGIGKSDAMGELCGRASSRGAVLELDLGEYSEASQLSEDLFNSSVFRQWTHGDGLLFLLLDSLDEAMVGVRNIVGLLQRKLADLPFDRLHVYLSCRTTAWPETLTNHLVECYGDEQAVGVYHLVPLSRSAIALAATSVGIDAERFLREVADHNAQALASNPLTLRLLLNLFESGLPASSTELMERGLLALCEPPDVRKDHGTAEPYHAAQLLAVASRLAALTLLSGASFIETGSDVTAPAGGVRLGDCVGGEEGDGAARVIVDEAAVRATLKAGPFNGRGPHRFAFAHKSYGEFLAARFLARLDLPSAQLECLLCLEDRTPKAYVPQLRETIAWIASFDKRVLENVAQREPEILLAADLPTEGAVTKAQIVEALIVRTQRGKLSYEQPRALAPQLRRLAHGGLAQQILTSAADRALSDTTRELTLTIAEQCGLCEAADVAATIALDSRESLGLRIDAAYAVCRLAVPEARARLKPLAYLPREEDPDDELRGLALRACWPRHMSAAEMFRALENEQRTNLHGSYAEFLRTQRIADILPPNELGAALAWVASQNLDWDYWGARTQIAGALVTRAFRDGREDLIEQLAPIVYDAYHDFRCPFFAQPHGETFRESNDVAAVNRMLEVEVESRRRLILAIFEQLPERTHLGLLAHSDCPLVQENDFGWLLDRACAASGEAAFDWAEFARRVMCPTSEEHLAKCVEASRQSSTVASVLESARFIWLDSAEARALKARYLRELRERGPAMKQPIAPEQQETRIERLLEQVIGDRPDLFTELAFVLHRDLESGEYEHVPADLRETRGWKVANDEIRRRVVDAAENYFARSSQPQSEPLSTVHQWRWADESPSLALLLLLNERPAAIGSMPDAVWQRRTGHILARLIGYTDATAEQKQTICQLLYHNAPDECRRIILAIIDNAPDAGNLPAAVRLWKDRLDQELASELFARVVNPDLDQVRFSELLGWLLRQKYEPAIPYAEVLLQRVTQPRSLPTAILVARELPERFWPVVYRLMTADRRWAREFIGGVLRNGDEGGKLVSVLKADQAGDLLSWLLTEYPTDEDDRSASGVVSERDQVRFFKGALIERLRREGTREACAVLRAVRDRHADQPWLADAVLQAEAVERQLSWRPPAPNQLRRLFTDRAARLVENPSQLLALLCESLDRFEQSLHDELPARGTLWDFLPSGVQRPKTEEDLSDSIARHLRADLADRGTVVNREVQIRRREVAKDAGGEPGQLTDIRIDAVAAVGRRSGPDVVSVVLEVKGCWNEGVQTSMKLQLADRYLRDNKCQTGLYVVGWFWSPTWDQADSRRKQVPWKSKQEAETELTVQAMELSSKGSLQIRSYVLDCALR